MSQTLIRLRRFNTLSRLNRLRGLSFWVLRSALVAIVLLALVLVWLLVRAIDQNSINDQNLTQLLMLNGVVAIVLFAIIGAASMRLWQRLRQQRFGSRLLLRFAVLFALTGFVPGVLIYSVSYQFVARSIESWFDVRVDAALEAGLNLARSTMDSMVGDLQHTLDQATQQIDLGGDVQGLQSALNALREAVKADEAELWSPQGQRLASSGSESSPFALSLEKPSSKQLRNLKSQRSIHVFEGLETHAPAASLRILMNIYTSDVALTSSPRVLVVKQKLPTGLAQNAITVESAYSEYQERSLVRSGLKKMYIGTLTLTLFLAVLGALALAVILGNQIAKPLLMLAQGVQRVSQGNLEPIKPLPQNHELADLTRAFARMTAQLAQAQASEQKAQRIAAWNEVAQRLAHEIKNPLTPIQLSAERLLSKLLGKLAASDQALLEKSIKTIVDQVDAMKRLVNEFRDYARLPSAQLLPVDLVAVLHNTLALYETQIHSGILTVQVPQVPKDSDNALPAPTHTHTRIAGDAQQLRQVLHNLIQNALDAAQAGAHAAAPRVHIRVSSDAEHVRMHIWDNGRGFSPHMLSRAFEPYNTTKPKGTGLGLALVQKIMHEHKAQVQLGNVVPAEATAMPDAVQAQGHSQQAQAPLDERLLCGAVVLLTFPALAALQT